MSNNQCRTSDVMSYDQVMCSEHRASEHRMTEHQVTESQMTQVGKLTAVIHLQYYGFAGLTSCVNSIILFYLMELAN
jgi:hypothetical protein